MNSNRFDLWNKYKLTIVPSITGDAYWKAVRSHNLVCKYLEEHPGKLKSLSNETGIKYFEVLDLAEELYK